MSQNQLDTVDRRPGGSDHEGVAAPVRGSSVVLEPFVVDWQIPPCPEHRPAA
jgi:hypothetical protein